MYSGPCAAVCNNNDTTCLQAARSVSHTCAPAWSSFYNAGNGEGTPGPGWTAVTVTSTIPARTSIATVEKYTSFSKANMSFLVGIPATTMTPVYALGSPLRSLSVTTYSAIRETIVSYTGGPSPRCKFNAVSREWDCGQCTMTGGTVQLFYWPSTTLASSDTALNTLTTGTYLPLSAVLNSTTLYSPTVYISLQSVHAQNSCSHVGGTHTGTMIAINARDVSTLVHFGGAVLQSGANQYGPLNYADLTGIPRASVYEHQESCLFGCATIYPTPWSPTLVVPTQLRSIDPAWRSCAVGLEGL